MMFYPAKGAFRAGIVNGTQWNYVNVGLSSTATGLDTKASATGSTAMGYSTTASNIFSTAMGYGSTASGTSSTATGFFTIASGNSSTAMGDNTIASGNYSFSAGHNVAANLDGSFFFGDSDPNGKGVRYLGLTNEFVCRFNGGYYFITGDVGPDIGVQVLHNGNAWVSVCDQKRKENFEKLDGEDVLQKISNINFTSWNYKQQDPKIYRHYGIMAQDFYNAFGKDKYGSIGNDTTVNPIDMIGIDMTAIQALEKRTSELKNQHAMLNNKLSEVDELKKENESLKKSIAQLQTQFDQQQKLIAQSLDQLKTLTLKQVATETVAVK